MNEIARKLTEEVKLKMAAIAAETGYKSLVEATKAATETGSFEVVISTADFDRQGESVSQAGWDLANYKENPVVLWGHDYYSLPIGICDSISVEGGRLIAKGRFAPAEANPFAQQVRKLYDLKIVRATSVGFIALEQNGSVITKAELLEFSFVPVPANPYALSLGQVAKAGLDLAMLATKGLKLETKAEGDACTMDDGEEGTYDAEGICKPKGKAMGDDCEMDDGGAGTMQDDGNGGMVCKPKAAPEPEKHFCAVCAKDVPKDSRCLGRFIIDPGAAPNHLEDCKTDEQRENWKKTPDIFGKKFLSATKDAQAIGAVLAELSNIVADAIVRASKLILDIIQSEYAQSVAGKAAIAKVIAEQKHLEAIKTAIGEFGQKLGLPEPEEHRDGDAAKERSEAAGDFANVMKGLDDFNMMRKLLQSVATASSAALSGMKQVERERKAAKK